MFDLSHLSIHCLLSLWNPRLLSPSPLSRWHISLNCPMPLWGLILLWHPARTHLMNFGHFFPVNEYHVNLINNSAKRTWKVRGKKFFVPPIVIWLLFDKKMPSLYLFSSLGILYVTYNYIHYRGNDLGSHNFSTLKNTKQN